jgi:hypothetical protein
MKTQMSNTLVLERAIDLVDTLVKAPTDQPPDPLTRGRLNDEIQGGKSEEKRLTHTFHRPPPEHARVAALLPTVDAPGPHLLGTEVTCFPTA